MIDDTAPAFVPVQGQQHQPDNVEYLNADQATHKKNQLGLYFFGICNYKGREKAHYPKPEARVYKFDDAMAGHQQLVVTYYGSKAEQIKQRTGNV